jgi:fluoride exporter
MSPPEPPSEPPSEPPHDPHPGFPVDSDVEVPPPSHLRADVTAAVATGGALGALARWGVAEALPHDPGRFPWSTLVANVVGCFLIGVLIVLVVERWSHRPLARPFLGTGVLGGFTTFSTYAVDTRGLLAAGRPAVAASYLLGTLAVGLLAVVAGLRLTEKVLR